MKTKLNNENKRYERKFVVKELEMKKVEYIIMSNPFIFSEIFQERRVNNLYLDDFYNNNYIDNLVGNTNRIKIRIRWYGETLGYIKKPILEIKIKNGELGNKMSFPLKSFTIDKNFSKNKIQSILFSSNLPKEIMNQVIRIEMVLLNSYKRKYFLSSNKKYRITLDREILFFRIKSYNNHFFETKTYDNKLILELKYNKEDDDYVDVITNYFPFRLDKSSRYIDGIDILEI